MSRTRTRKYGPVLLLIAAMTPPAASDPVARLPDVAEPPTDDAPAAKPVAAPSERGDSSPTGRWQGHWQAYSYGSEYWTIRISDRNFHAVLGPDDWYTGKITLRAGASPAEIDFLIEDCRCAYKGETSHGIYEWEGEEIILAAPSPGKPRPRVFNPDTGEMVRLVRIEE